MKSPLLNYSNPLISNFCLGCMWYLDYGNLDRAGSVCGECGRDLDDLRSIQAIQEDHKVYCDLDGVLADFVKQWVDYYQLDPSAYRKQHGSDAFHKQLSDAPIEFWSEMPWLPEGPTIWNHVRLYNPTILSAPPNEGTAGRKGKIEWITKHLGPITPPYVFKRSEHKSQLSSPSAILIDDYHKNVTQWQSRGGFGILHQGNADNTIKQLLQYGKQQYYKP